MSTSQQHARRGPSRGTAARQASLREHNLSLVLGHVLDADGPVSRADLAAATGLTRATVSALVDLLVESRVLAEGDPVQTGSAGRPAVPLTPARGTLAGLGLEVNVDYLGVRAVDLAGDVLESVVVPGDHHASDPAVVLADLTAHAEAVVGRLEARGIDVIGAILALPGLVDPSADRLRLAPNLGWADVDLSALREVAPFDRLGLTVTNEANLAAVAEWRARSRHLQSFLYVSGEVGIGGALLHDNAVFGGVRGWSGELGHTTVEPDGPECACGARGCLEAYAGKDALMVAAGLDRLGPVADLRARADDGDTAALAALARAGWALGVALANFVNLTDVAHVVLGGVYGPLEPYLRAHVTAELDARVLTAPRSDLVVEPSVAGDEAAMTGGAVEVLRGLIANPSSRLPS
ncbi:ROK family transcriptional regulator [Sanguibacter sp. HDW7]|uniref:ROK family transcriptional regulator n=1 Tax=Sanguibacter sp. HDW7 TaxID=2714931 RepID=UPI00140D4826|nr:ROK family transcriptional regulator [Sanguibacter sp. HDW7]QIK84380.1 ROK family protein [Sanguibacter sp. HDW7]